MTEKHLTEVQIQCMIASYHNAPEVTDEQHALAKPFIKTFPGLAEAMRKIVRGVQTRKNRKAPCPCAWTRALWLASRLVFTT
jgi:hypothetical protein